MASDDSVEFTFGWLALQLLGKSLYSNAWTAISELVANGLDAGASMVYVYIDATMKNKALIEIFDNGIGMDRDGLSTYVQVGRDRRREDRAVQPAGHEIMGRKGIGKLAALYLSEDYFLVTRHGGASETRWRMTYDKNRPPDEKPLLSTYHDRIDIKCSKEWDACKTGTLLQMRDVDLTGLGEAAFESLSQKLSNHFSLDSIGGRKILLRSIVPGKKDDGFKILEKRIAFGNMAYIDYNSDDPSEIPGLIESHNEQKVLCAYPTIRDKQYEHQTAIADFETIQMINDPGDDGCLYKGFYEQTIDGKKITKYYELKGWVGIHSSIDDELSTKNDAIFKRNRFYNPMQLRLYVRNKLAVENFLDIVNMTQTFTNYIEGEIRFDILDDDDLRDIATTNRQGLDEHDDRVELLSLIVRKIVGDLIRKKKDLTALIADLSRKANQKKETNAKRQFSNEVNKELSSRPELSKEIVAETVRTITNQIKGDVALKDQYMIFISHSSSELFISDFFYRLLLYRGVKVKEIFYTGDKDNADYKNLAPLGEQIKENIVNVNALLFFLTSEGYMKNQYCLFEGGAGWATRGIGEFILLPIKYEEKPDYLSNGKREYKLVENIDDEIELDRRTYTIIRLILNEMIAHINKGREVGLDQTVEPFSTEAIPEDKELVDRGIDITSCMDPDIVDYWKSYVDGKQHNYMCERRNGKGKQSLMDGICGNLDRYFSPKNTDGEEERMKNLEESCIICLKKYLHEHEA